MGVDMAAPKGTPIHATSAGVIIYRGRMGGYGNVVILRNSSIYSTRYAHMQRFAKDIKLGRRVHEGQVLGYVGQTGLATGPHLHYEFRIHKKPVNPLTVKLPQAAPIRHAQRSRFLIYAHNLADEYFMPKKMNHSHKS